jgi:hypothetical protein
MESFPEKYTLFPKTEQFITKVKDFARFVTHQETELCLSEHRRERGAEAMLSQSELPFNTPHAVAEGWLAYDSEGNYISGDI